ncbi:hypothetical protein [Streptomyces orinoci]|uniref:Uncharacterized protein n=1 Tax=Streptomyces orinoci TaxID=67339 RepID=A0ABV3K7G9_STRON|nr:hypothetical protein [Streptomyces orinoci]
MAFEEEWSELRARALESHQKSTKLDSAAGNQESANLNIAYDKHKSAISALQDRIGPDTKRSGSHADEATHAAASELKGWDTAVGLKSALEEWSRQVSALVHRLGTEKVGLEGTKTSLSGTDHALKVNLQSHTSTGSGSVPQSKISGY